MAFVQGAGTGSSASGTSLACTYTNAVAVGDLLVACYGWLSTSTAFAISDSLSATPWTLLTPAANSSLPYAAGIAYKVADTAGTPTVTLSGAAQTYRRLAIHEYSGVNTFDQSAGASGNSGTLSSGTVTTTQPNELIVGWLINNSGGLVAGSGFTLREDAMGEYTEDSTLATAGAIAATATGTSSQWLALVATFYEAASTTTVTVTVYGDDGSSASVPITISGSEPPSPPAPVNPPVIT